MSLLDKASLIVTPNAYKEGKLYSVVPSSGSGDMSFSRSTTATRVNSIGLVESVPRNLLTYSNDLNNGVWAVSNVTKTNGQVSPTSANNEGWLINKTSTGVDGLVYNGFLISSLNKHTYSWYILKDTNESRFPEFFLRLNTGETEQYIQLNTKTGALGVRVASSGCTRSITLSPDGLWWRLTLTNPAPTSTTGDNRHGMRPAAGTTLGVYNINATGSVIVYGAQTEEGTTATNYFQTTTRLNIPRIDYTNGSCPSLLVEPQRTNLTKNSQIFNTVFWNRNLTTVVDNNAISPDGTTNASNLTEVAGTGSHHIHETVGAFTPTVSSSYTISCFVKLPSTSAGRFVQLPFFIAGFGSNAYANFDLLNGVVGTTGSAITSSSIKNYNNGWYRISATAPATAVGLSGFQLSLITSSSSARTESYTVSSGSEKSILMYGAQLELGSYPTSYIPTLASTVTRNTDIPLSIATPLLLNDFSIFMDFRLIQNNYPLGYMIFGSIDASNISRIYIDSGDNMTFTIGATNNSIGTSGLNINTDYKVCFKRSGSTLKYFRNGILINTFTVQTNQFKLSTFFNGVDGGGDTSKYLTLGNLKTGIAFNTALTDAECIALTTL